MTDDNMPDVQPSDLDKTYLQGWASGWNSAIEAAATCVTQSPIFPRKSDSIQMDAELIVMVGLLQKQIRKLKK